MTRMWLPRLILAMLACAVPVTAQAQVKIAFDAVDNYGIRQIRADGAALLVGCGFGFIGSETGADNQDNITSCRRNNLGTMLPFRGGSAPYLPFTLTFKRSKSNPAALEFEGSLGPSSYDFATVSMPMDSNSARFTHYRFEGAATARSYKDASHAYAHERGPVSIAQAPGHPSWGEIIGADYTIRVTLTRTSRRMALFFVNHPDTRNVEFSFGRVAVGARATIAGRVEVYRTDPAVFGRVQSIFESERDFMHQIGRRDADGWSVNVRDRARAFMSYGPYTSAVRSGRRTATFRLMVDNVGADNNRLLTIEVFDSETGKRLAARDVRRREFARPFAYQAFDVGFTAVSGHRLEFRTYWHGGSYVRQDNVTIR